MTMGTSIEETLPQLRQQWFGRRRGLHIYSWRGGYDPNQLAEQHAFGLVVATSAPAAKARARSLPVPGGVQAHTDDLHAIDECLPITLLEGWHVHLIADPRTPAQPLVPDWFGYRRIDRG
jgi:hypothetical protein